MDHQPPHSEHDIASILERQAERIPEHVFFLMRDATEIYGGFNTNANRFAHGLAALGVRLGDMVAVMMPNVPEFLCTRFAIHKLGAIETSINTTFRGPGLTHMLNLCEARVLVLDESFVDQVADIADSLFAVDTVIVRE